MRISRNGIAIVAAAVALWGFPAGAEAEIFERELGTDAAGNPVTGYVFQGGRGFGRRSSSSLRRSRTRSSVRRSGRISFGSPWYYYAPVFPLHSCGGFSRGSFSFWRVPVHSHHRRFSGGGLFSVTIIR